MSEGVVRVPDNVLMERVAGEIVFLDLTDHSYYGLDPIAARMMELLLTESTVAGVVDVLATEYNTTADVLARDVEHLIGQLVENGLVERVGPEPSMAGVPPPSAPPAEPAE